MRTGEVCLARPAPCLPGWPVAAVCWRSGRLARCGMKHLKISHLWGAAAAAVSALVLLTPGVAAAQAWTVVSSPSGGQLNGVASVSANDVWAVGIVSFSSPPVIVHWNGKRWASVAHPKQTGFLSGVAAVSASDVWAVGESQVPGVGLQTLIEHFNGRRWSVVPSPNIGPMDQLRGVTAVSASDVWAVGFAEPTSFANPQTLILHWDGTSWAVVPSPDPGRLAGVAAVSGSDIWAVGSVTDVNGITTTVIEQWNGTSWSVVPSPNPSPNENVLAAASADPVSTQAWAVGEFFNTTTS